MEKQNARKESKFLRELDDYYKARERHNTSFSLTACPQNFIPGTTKAKIPNVKLVRTASRKVSSVCFQGILVRLKDNMSVIEKGLVPAALLALGVPTPSQHTSCLEHEMERIGKRHYRKTIQSLRDISEVTKLVDNETDNSWNQGLIESSSFRPRCFSLPTTRRDLRVMPLEHDANIGSELARERKLRGNSLPVTREEHTECGHGSVDIEAYMELDSVMQLSELCRKAGQNHVTGHTGIYKTTDSKDRDGSHFTTSLNVMVSDSGDITITDKNSKQAQSVSMSPESRRLRKTAVSHETKTQQLGYEPEEEDSDDVENHHENEKAVCKEENRKKETGDKVRPQQRSFMDRITSKRQKKKETVSRSLSENDTLPEEQKNTFSQIQNVLRSKLPKTMQATVNIGLSFDPVTVKERNTKARECSNITAMLKGRDRSGSLPGNTDPIRKSVRSKTLGNIFMTPSLFVSPPETDDALEKQGIIGSFFRLGRRRSTNSTGKLVLGSPATMRKNLLSVPAPAFNPPLDSDGLKGVELHPMHVRKLGNLLGPEFSRIYSDSVKYRSNSLPLIRRNQLLPSNAGLLGTKSVSRLDNKRNKRFDFRKLWSDHDNSGSDMSDPTSNYDSTTDVELSDNEAEFGNIRNETEVGSVKNDTEVGFVKIAPHDVQSESTEKQSFTSKALVYLGSGKRSNDAPEAMASSEKNRILNQNEASGSTDEIKYESEIFPDAHLKYKMSQKVNADHVCVNSFPKCNSEKIINGFREKNSIVNETGNISSSNVMHMNQANKRSPPIVTKFVSLKTFKTLKSTDELIAESKINREGRRPSFGKEQKMEPKSQDVKEETNQALAELDALISELQAYE